jgi:hypothetical protein
MLRAMSLTLYKIVWIILHGVRACGGPFLSHILQPMSLTLVYKIVRIILHGGTGPRRLKVQSVETFRDTPHFDAQFTYFFVRITRFFPFPGVRVHGDKSKYGLTCSRWMLYCSAFSVLSHKLASF